MKKCCIRSDGLSRNEIRTDFKREERGAWIQRTCSEKRWCGRAVEKLCIRQIEERQKPASGQLKDIRMKPPQTKNVSIRIKMGTNKKNCMWCHSFELASWFKLGHKNSQYTSRVFEGNADSKVSNRQKLYTTYNIHTYTFIHISKQYHCKDLWLYAHKKRSFLTKQWENEYGRANGKNQKNKYCF